MSSTPQAFSSLQQQVPEALSGTGHTANPFSIYNAVVPLAILVLTVLLVASTYAYHRFLSGRSGRRLRSASRPTAHSSSTKHRRSLHSRRRRRRRSRRSNPTLAELGGAPDKRRNTSGPAHPST